MQYYISGPPMNPLARILAALVGVLALVGAFFFGIFIFMGAIALGLIAWLALWLRLWWIRRKLRAFGQDWPGDDLSGAPVRYSAECRAGAPPCTEEVPSWQLFCSHPVPESPLPLGTGLRTHQVLLQATYKGETHLPLQPPPYADPTTVL